MFIRRKFKRWWKFVIIIERVIIKKKDEGKCNRLILDIGNGCGYQELCFKIEYIYRYNKYMSIWYIYYIFGKR